MERRRRTTKNRQRVSCLDGWAGGGVAGRVGSLNPNLSLSFLLRRLWTRLSDLLARLPRKTQVRHSRDWEAGLSIQPSNLVPFSDGSHGEHDGVNGGPMRDRPSGMGGAPSPREVLASPRARVRLGHMGLTRCRGPGSLASRGRCAPWCRILPARLESGAHTDLRTHEPAHATAAPQGPSVVPSGLRLSA